MINVRQRKAIKLNGGVGESLFISFGKFDAELVRKVKTISTRMYVGDSKEWEVPLECIGEVLEILPHNELIIDEMIDLEMKGKEVKEVDKDGIFDKELSWIKNDDLLCFAKDALALLPDYFFHVAASSTGKYHPDYALGEGGLVRHTKSAMMIAHELFGNETVQDFSSDEQDIILVSLCLHDGLKHGTSGSNFTVATHPLEVTRYLAEKMGLLTGVGNWQIIKGCIESHMGQWNTDYRSKEQILPLPQSKIERFVHMCDYLASRKFLEVKFNL